MGAWMRFDLRKILPVGVGLACIVIAVLVLAHSGSARTSAKSLPASQGGCVNMDSVTRPECVRLGGRMRRRRPPFKLSPPGSVVRSSALFGDRVFLNANEGIALADGDNQEYPALSIDGGRVWRIAGPPLHVNAADGAEGVGSLGIANPRTWFAYGSSVVDVTTDHGRTWWEAYLGEEVVAVVPADDDELVAYVAESVNNRHPNAAVTWQYVSRDGGRRWHYSTDFPGAPG